MESRSVINPLKSLTKHQLDPERGELPVICQELAQNVNRVASHKWQGLANQSSSDKDASLYLRYFHRVS
jgi:hypothetical protein